MSEMNESEDDGGEAGIMDLPEEILEYILSLLSPYSDFQSARLVCRLWHKIMLGVVQQRHNLFLQSSRDGAITWSSLEPEFGTMISERYSHSACYHNKAIYVFGGCTSTSTTFNDLWRFDLSTRQWVRPLAIGTYPSPKACATLVSYKDSLILFGGWSHPTPLPLHQPNNFFNQLHIYSPKTNNWSFVPERASRTGHPSAPPGRAGHAASVVGDRMIVFGGSRAHSTRCQDVWVLDLETMTWDLVNVQGLKPRPRFGHSQIVLDPHHLLVIGGCAGPNMQFNDVWLLKMGEDDWCWRELKVLGNEHSPPKLWCHPACKVGDFVIILSKLSNRSPRLSLLESMDRPLKLSPEGPTKSPRGPHLDNSRKALPKRPLPETSESSSQESSSDSEERSMNARKYFGSSYSASRMTAQLSAALKVNQVDDGARASTSAASAQLEPSPSTSSQAHGSSAAGPYNNPDVVTGHASASTSATGYVPRPAGPIGQPIAGPSHCDPGMPHTLPVRDGMPSIRPNAMKNRQKQLEALRRHEERIRSKLNNPSVGGGIFQSPPVGASKRQEERGPQSIQQPMFLHALDISRAISDEEVRWHEVGADFSGLPPEDKIFYTLIHARGELVMFGGIKTDVNTMQRGIHSGGQLASNTTHFITAKPRLR